MTRINIKPTELAWYAGFYEGEGCICNDTSNSNHIRVSIAQNDNTPLIRAEEIWGGSIQKRIRKSPASDKICTGYDWRLCNKTAHKFIDDISPYLRIPYKMKQIEDALEKEKIKVKMEFKCPHCPKIYTNAAGRRRHIKTLHPNGDQNNEFKCDFCDKKFGYRDSKLRHERLKHQENPDASSDTE